MDELLNLDNTGLDTTEKFNYQDYITLDEQEQQRLVSMCMEFKESLKAHAQDKKEAMLTCFSYMKGEFVGNDLLPDLSDSLGSENDADTGRPQVFIPVVRQQLKHLFSQIKLTLFPNDEDYFKVRSKSYELAEYEDELTEGLKWLFKENKITERLGLGILNLVWAGNAPSYPCIKQETKKAWTFNLFNGQVEPKEYKTPPRLDVECWSPLDFYIDPTATDDEHFRWGYFCTKKISELKKSGNIGYINLDKLDGLGKKDVENSQDNRFNTSFANKTQNTFQDIEDHVDYDLFYFPYIDIDGRELENIVVGIAGETVVVRLEANTQPNGANPVKFGTWMPDSLSPYGTGPVEDIKELQRLINIIWNYMIESAARNGNKWIAGEDTDLSQFFGTAGGVAYAKDPRNALVNVGGTMSELSPLLEATGILKSEAQNVTGSQNPFNGLSDEVNSNKTATEWQIRNEHTMTILREVIEHISVTWLQANLQALMELVGQWFTDPIEVRIDDKLQGTYYKQISFDVINQNPGNFAIEITSTNASQSKLAMNNTLKELIGLAGTDPEVASFVNKFNLVKTYLTNEGFRNIDELLQQSMPQAPMLPDQMGGMDFANIQPQGQAGFTGIPGA